MVDKILPLLEGITQKPDAPIHAARLPGMIQVRLRPSFIDKRYKGSQEAPEKETMDVLKQRDEEEEEDKYGQLKNMQGWIRVENQLQKGFRVEKLFDYTDNESGETNLI